MSTYPASRKDHTDPVLGGLINAFSALRAVYPDMTLNQAIILLAIADGRATTQRDLMELTGLSDATASRIVGFLSDYGRRGALPLRLVDLHDVPHDRRIKVVRLNAKGRALVEGVRAHVKEGAR